MFGSCPTAAPPAPSALRTSRPSTRTGDANDGVDGPRAAPSGEASRPSSAAAAARRRALGVVASVGSLADDDAPPPPPHTQKSSSTVSACSRMMTSLLDNESYAFSTESIKPHRQRTMGGTTVTSAAP